MILEVLMAELMGVGSRQISHGACGRVNEDATLLQGGMLTPTLERHCAVNETGFIHRLVAIGDSSWFGYIA